MRQRARDYVPAALRLVALLLPAVQSSREAARRSQCAGKLRQIALGLATYLSDRRAFPPGTRFASLLLQSSAAEGTLTNISGQNTPVPIFKCSSDSAPRPGDPSTNYFGVQGGGAEGDASCQAGAASNRLGVSEQPLVLAAAVGPINSPLVDYNASRPWVDGSGGLRQ